MFRITTILPALTLMCTIMNAQSPLVEKNFDSKPLNELVRYIEEREHVRFFYLNNWIDSIIVIQKKVPYALDSIMTETLGNTKVKYFRDYQGNLILTRNYSIQTGFDFYSERGDEARPADTAAMKSSFLFSEHEGGQKENQGVNTIMVGTPAALSKSGATISGFVREKETGQPITGALVYIDDLKQGSYTDNYGYYIITVPAGNHPLSVKYIGRREVSMKIVVAGSGTLNISMEERLLELRGVVISADRDNNIKGLQMAVDKVETQTIKQISSAMGEGDLMKTALLLPGVKTVGEGAAGFNVRGGGTDQNLILMDGSPVFNSSHVFGFFSVFNPDVVKDFKLYKSGIPSQYGGRLSSVMDVSIRSGDMKKFSLYGGLSPVSARIAFEGPLIKDKASFLLSSRTSYSDWVLRKIKVPALMNSNAGFTDFNLKADYSINETDRISFSGYLSGDNFRLNSDTLYLYSSRNLNLSYKHNFSGKLFSLMSSVYSDYSYSVSADARPAYSFGLKYSIRYYELKDDYTWFLNARHKLAFGANIIKYKINPGSLDPSGAESLIKPVRIPDEQAVETGIYASDEYTVNDDLSLSYGLRYSGFFSLGPASVYTYMPGVPRSISSRIDSSYYNKNRISSARGGPELRFLLRYRLDPASSIKISYTRMYQYLQMISNTTAISPTDVWKISGPNMPAQYARQVSAGFFRYLFSDKVLSSVEAYYKLSRNILEYRGGTLILMNPDLETDLLFGTGKSYGLEFLMKKEYGALSGWLSYTWSRSFIKVDSKYLADRINNGHYYPSNYDKPHDITMVANYRFSRMHSVSTTVTYSSGRPITYPVAKYQFMGREFVSYSDRNEYRIPDYFRWDVAVNIEGILKARSFMQNSLSLSVYNITGRDNTYSIFFRNDGNKKIQGYKLSVFSQPVVSVTYNFRF